MNEMLDERHVFLGFFKKISMLAKMKSIKEMISKK